MPTEKESRTLRFAAGAMVIAACLVFAPCAIAILLASWGAILARPLTKKLTRKLDGRTKAAAIVTIILVLSVLVPIGAAIVPIVFAAIDLSVHIGRSQRWHDVALAISGDAAPVDPLRLLREHVSNAWGAASMLLRSSAQVFFSIAMFMVSFFAFLKDGDTIVQWLKDRSPFKASHFDRIANAYAETGRGLVIGVGLTALIQGLLATVTYAIVGIPHALPLGFLTTIGALVPGFGTMLVWGPIAAALGLSGHPAKAVVVALCGALIISSGDNFLKPILTNRASLKLSPVLLFITMLSGLAAFGASGLLLGPLLVRLAIEMADILRDERLTEMQAHGLAAKALEPSKSVETIT